MTNRSLTLRFSALNVRLSSAYVSSPLSLLSPSLDLPSLQHRQYAMVRPSADILALNLVDIPFKLVTIFFFDLVRAAVNFCALPTLLTDSSFSC